MASNWPEVEFGDLLPSGTRNGVYKAKGFHGTGVKIVNMGELFAHPRLRDVPMKRVELTESELEKSSLQAGDLLFARRSLVAEGAGKCSIVMEVNEPTTFESSIIRARPDGARADSLFLYYLFTSPQGRYLLGTILRQVAVSGITGTDLVKLRLSLPPLKDQQAIACILGTLDDKIELNRRMSQTLEAMARAIFQSWFVDFDPVHQNIARAASARRRVSPRKTRSNPRTGVHGSPDLHQGLPPEIATLFPDAFENSELGEIPKGWKVGTVGDIVTIDREALVPGDFPDEVFDHYSIPAYDAGRNPASDQGSTIKSQKFLVTDQAVLVSKLNPKTPRVWIPDPSAGRRQIASTEFLVCRPKTTCSIDRAYFYCLCCDSMFSDHLTSRASGTSNSHQRVRPQDFLAYGAPIPPDVLAEAFQRQVKPLLDRTLHLHHESRTLVALREALLPKLLSGQIDVSGSNSVGCLTKGD